MMGWFVASGCEWLVVDVEVIFRVFFSGGIKCSVNFFFFGCVLVLSLV